MDGYDTKKGRTIRTLVYIAAAIVYLFITAALVRIFGWEDLGWLRFLLTIPHEVILIVGGLKLFKSAEQIIGKIIGVVLIGIAAAEFVFSIFVNLGQYF